ncbi:MAG: tRNA methyl transferase PRC-barrel domain-containing protein, partial [Patescibacteria group bacterium]
LGKISLNDFLKKYIPEKRGDVLLALNSVKGDTIYEKIGKHKGAHFYTIGQRHGLGIGGSKKPYYVAEKNVKKNIIMVAEGNDNPALYKKEIKLTDVNFINHDFYSLIRANKRISILTKVRYRQPLISATLKIENSKLKIEFDAPIKFVAPGQSAVFYSKKGEMLGGGVII